MSKSPKDGKQPKKREKCPYGFECSLFMLLPGTIAHDCENLTTCKEQSGSPGFSWHDPDQPSFEMVMYFEDEWQEYEVWMAEYAERQRRQQEWQEEMRRYRQIIIIQQHEAATVMLKSRGNHQEYSNFEIDELAAQVSETLDSFFSELEQLVTNDNGYIAPDGIEAHVYNVKRPSRNEFPKSWNLREVRRHQTVYYYHKLTSKEAQFKAMEKDDEGNYEACKVIHLSHSDNARNIQGRLGIERRNKLNKIRTRLLQAQQALEEAVAIAEQTYSYEDILLQSQEAANELDTAELQQEEQ